MGEKICEEKTVNEFIKENTEIILNIKSIAHGIKDSIFGSNNTEADCNNCSPTSMLHALENQNYDLKRIINDLELIRNTIIAN